MWGLISKPLMRWFSWHPQFCLTFFLRPYIAQSNFNASVILHSQQACFFNIFMENFGGQSSAGLSFYLENAQFFFKKGSFFSKNAQFFGQKCSLFSKCSPKSSVSGLCLNLVMLFFNPETLVYWVFPLRQEVLPSGSVFSPETTSEFFPQFFVELSFLKMSKEQAWFIVSTHCLIVNVRMVK